MIILAVLFIDVFTGVFFITSVLFVVPSMMHMAIIPWYIRGIIVVGYSFGVFCLCYEVLRLNEFYFLKRKGDK